MSQRSSRLALPYLASGQAQKHVTVNEALLRLDALVQLAVVSATTAVQPGSPVDGSVYILPPGKTGAAWDAMANYALAYYRDGAWEEIAPREGWIAAVNDSDRVLRHTGVSWLPIAPLISPADGVATLVNAAESGFDRLQFGGSTAAFPAWKRSGAELHARLADDSGFAGLRALQATLGGGPALMGASSPALAVTQTWNNAGATFEALRLDVTDTASAPNSTLIDFYVGGSSMLQLTKAGNLQTRGNISVYSGNISSSNSGRLKVGTRAAIGSGADGLITLYNNAETDFSRLQFGGATSSFPALKRSSAELHVVLADDSAWANIRCHSMVANSNVFCGDGGYFSVGGSGDVKFYRDGPAQLALRNGANAQSFRVYNTYTDALNYERGALYWTGNQLRVAAQRAGTGSAREISFETNSSVRWRIGTGGDFLAGADSSYDIGGPGGGRPRNAYLGGFLSIGDGVAAPVANVGEAKIYVDVADGDLKIVFGDGTVRTIVTD